jgi:hypothetical protein
MPAKTRTAALTLVALLLLTQTGCGARKLWGKIVGKGGELLLLVPYPVVRVIAASLVATGTGMELWAEVDYFTQAAAVSRFIS